MSFEIITDFENKIAEFFGAKYAVAVDCCTHGVELSLRYQKHTYISTPKRTYISIPFLSNKLNLRLDWREEEWKDYYIVNPTSPKNRYKAIYDAAVLWKKDSYIPNSFMCISFQFQKHLSLGKGGIILCDNKEDAIQLKKMSYDGRDPNVPWREQDINTYGYHYYMTPETAQMGLDRLDKAIKTPPKQWVVTDWPDLTQMQIFKK
jgi:dTDP-4-amino-4,6-dideoxygalactose transaminase|tara:strand:+ start:2941 stop:3555 length:615 start_codon:yes stop_codon:yes gene_type:complete